MSNNPLAQFEIKTIVPIDIAGIDMSITNSSVAMIATVAAISVFLLVGMKSRLVPGRWQSLTEVFYTFVADTVKDNLGSAGRKYFPLIFTIFMLILFSNLIGMLPYSFSVYSHIAVTFALSMFVFILATLVGIAHHGLGFLRLFAPSGVPGWMYPLLIPIEVISYLSRPVSMSVRLFANMTAGATMMKVFASFIIMLGVLGGWAPFLVDVALTGFKFLVAFLQAYVFTVLTCIYLNDSIHLH